MPEESMGKMSVMPGNMIFEVFKVMSCIVLFAL